MPFRLRCFGNFRHNHAGVGLLVWFTIIINTEQKTALAIISPSTASRKGVFNSFNQVVQIWAGDFPDPIHPPKGFWSSVDKFDVQRNRTDKRRKAMLCEVEADLPCVYLFRLFVVFGVKSSPLRHSWAGAWDWLSQYDEFCLFLAHLLFYRVPRNML